MKRLHVSLAVADLDASVRFYTTFFDTPPTVLKSDYAKWMLEDPRVNFVVNTRGARKGLDHLGVQVDGKDALETLHGRLRSMAAPLIEQGETTCCYARSEKNWVFDPEGVAWETFLTTGDSPVYGVDDARINGQAAEAERAAAGGNPQKGACCADSSSARGGDTQ